MKKAQDICAPIPARRSGLRRTRFQMLSLWYGDERAANEIAAHTYEPKPLADLLDAELSNIRRPENGMLITLRAQWPTIAGNMFSRFCEPESLNDGVLTLKVKHSALLMELKPCCDIFCTKVNQVLGEGSCKEIKLRV
jgi:hypothetical protein